MRKKVLAAFMAAMLFVSSGSAYAAELTISDLETIQESLMEEVVQSEDSQDVNGEVTEGQATTAEESTEETSDEDADEEAQDVENEEAESENELTEAETADDRIVAQETMLDGLAVNIMECRIDEYDGSTVKVTAYLNENDTSTPESLYLFAISAHADSLEGYAPIAEAQIQADGFSYVFVADLLNGEADSRLYSKFVVAAGNGEQYVPVSGDAYITNPEVLAEDSIVAMQANANLGHNSKKGIQVVQNILSDVEDLGVSHAFFNIILEDVISLNPTSYSYNYGGTTYYFNESIINDYDSVLTTLAENGVTVTIALLNEYRSGYEFLIHPDASYNAGTYGYAWNTVDAKSSAYIQATLNYLATRYNGSDVNCGAVTNWVIGNEVNDNLQYYYMGLRDKESFVTEYYKTFRIAYNAIKSGNSHANVYIPLEPRWMTEDTTKDYGGRGFLESFNSKAQAEGNFDWGVAYHAYSHPISTDSILHDGTSMINQDGIVLEAGHVTDSWDSPVVTMKNIHVLTNYLNESHVRDTSGNVRSVILAEQGWTSISNTGATEQTQAANIALAYYKAEMNPDIDAFILRAHVDGDEGSPYFKFGLWNCANSNYATTKKYAYNIYKYMDTKESLKVTGFALSTLGISDWASVVPGFDASKFENMRSIEMAGITNLNSWSEATNSTVIAQNMMDTNWVNQYNTHGIGIYDHYGNYRPQGVAVSNPYAYYLSYQGLKYDFETPYDITDTPYLGFTITMEPNPKPESTSDANDKVLVRIRVISGAHVNDSNAVLDMNTDYNLCVNLSDWEYRNAIDRIEVWIQEDGQQKSFDGTFTIYNLQAAESVGSGTAMAYKPELNPAAVTFAFSDVPVIEGNWKYESVKYVYEKGIMNGISATTRFDPDAPLTRAMFATVLYRMAGSPDVAYTDKFSDVIDGKWYSKAIIWANQQGIVSGMGDGSYYGIDINITREQIAKMLNEYAKTSNYDVSQTKSLDEFTDKDTVSGWATGYMEWATAVGMISGKPNGDGNYRLDPKGEATRAECAAMLMRFAKKYEE